MQHKNQESLSSDKLNGNEVARYSTIHLRCNIPVSEKLTSGNP